MSKIIDPMAALMVAAAYRPVPHSHFGATRNIFLGALPVFEPPDSVLGQLQKALEDRDTETLKKLATIEVNTKATTDRLTEHGARLAEIEQRMTQRPGDRSLDARRGGPTFGKSLAESDAFKALHALPEQSRKGHRADVIVKATITSLTTDAAGSAGAAVVPESQSLDVLPRRRLLVRDLLPVVAITSGSVEVPVMKARTLNAGMVAEGDAKPQSDLQLELKPFPARVIAHWMLASKQILSDVPQLEDLINGELLYGLGLKEEQQLLFGDNTGENLHGMVPQATAYSDPLAGTSGEPPIDNYIDIIGRAMLQTALGEYPADGIVMHPSDWMIIRLTKNADGDYIYGPPGGPEPIPRIFGQPVVPTQAMTVDKFLVGQFQRAATIYDRWEAHVEVSTEDSDNFRKNLVTLLGEERLAFAVKRGGALVYGDFSDALTG